MEFPLSLTDLTLAFQTGYHNLELVGQGKDQNDSTKISYVEQREMTCGHSFLNNFTWMRKEMRL